MPVAKHQRDALAKLICTACGRAAVSLSELTGQHVSIAVPDVAVHPTAETHAMLSDYAGEETLAIHLAFTGAIEGNAFALFQRAEAIKLVGQLAKTRPPLDRLDASDQEVVTEVGNELVNACLQAFGEQLQARIHPPAPHLHTTGFEALLKTIAADEEAPSHVLIAFTTFQLQEATIAGCLVILLGEPALKRLLEGRYHA
ncbi:MAG: hypothetical protein GXP39_13200 [Chloroflexi bacterium]|nr:hypothetical protein [Chloroflexota bacterium]